MPPDPQKPIRIPRASKLERTTAQLWYDLAVLSYRSLPLFAPLARKATLQDALIHTLVLEQEVFCQYVLVDDRHILATVKAPADLSPAQILNRFRAVAHRALIAEEPTLVQKTGGIFSSEAAIYTQGSKTVDDLDAWAFECHGRNIPAVSFATLDEILKRD